MKNFWTRKKVLVTGGAGFIGSHMADALVERGALVTVAVSPKKKKRNIRHNLRRVLEDITVIYVDLLQKEDCIYATRGHDVVMNFAAMDGNASFKRKYPAEIFATNTRIVLNLLEASHANNVQRFLLMSSIDVYPKDAESPVKEEYATWDVGAEGYAWSKRVSEIAARMYYEQYGLKVAIARAGNVYGPRDSMAPERRRVVATFIHDALHGKPIEIWGNAQSTVTLLYVTDLIEALLSLTQHHATSQPLNICGSEEVTLFSLARTILLLTGRKDGVRYDRTKSVDVCKKLIDNSKAKKILHFKESVSMEEGLRKSIQFFKG